MTFDTVDFDSFATRATSWIVGGRTKGSVATVKPSDVVRFGGDDEQPSENELRPHQAILGSTMGRSQARPSSKKHDDAAGAAGAHGLASCLYCVPPSRRCRVPIAPGIPLYGIRWTPSGSSGRPQKTARLFSIPNIAGAHQATKDRSGLA
jgi:hypothetical protein